MVNPGEYEDFKTRLLDRVFEPVEETQAAQ
jgi:hypothetical protein